MATAIELYQKAYNVDYRQGDWEYAEELYNKIVEKFPHSEEKEYALVRLERIAALKGNPEDENLKPVTAKGGGSGGLGITGFVLSLLLVGVTGFLSFLFVKQNIRLQYNDLVTASLVNQINGDLVSAEIGLKTAIKTVPEYINAHVYLTELYISKGEFKKADKLLRRINKIKPQALVIKRLKKKIAKAQKNIEEKAK